MILINGRFLAQQTTGVQRFATEITLRLLKINDKYKVIIPRGCLCKTDFPIEQIIEAGPASPYLWEQFFLPHYLRKLNCPLLLNFTGLGPVFYKNKVITIHDLSFWEHPQWFSKKYYWFYKIFTPISAKRARMIFTVSECSKQAISDLLKIETDKITVVYNAVNPYQKKGYSRCNYILAVGSIDPRKNIELLVKAFNHWNNPEYKLILVGGKQASFQKIKIQHSEKIIFTGYISDQELFDYYEKSSIFIYPSLYEGFGIPPLEAMSVGTPVIASNIPVLKESCGEAAFYIDPYSVESMVNALETVCNDEELRIRLSNNGYENIKRFSWEETAQKIDRIVNNLIE